MITVSHYSCSTFLFSATDYSSIIRVMSTHSAAHEPSGAADPIAVVHVSTSSVKIAKTLARDVIKNDLAVGVSVLPTVSTMYKWKGEVLSENETFMIVKTRSSRVEELLRYVKSIGTTANSNDDCEVFAMRVENECDPYLDWLTDRIPENSEYLSKKPTK